MSYDVEIAADTAVRELKADDRPDAANVTATGSPDAQPLPKPQPADEATQWLLMARAGDRNFIWQAVHALSPIALRFPGKSRWRPRPRAIARHGAGNLPASLARPIRVPGRGDS